MNEYIYAESTIDYWPTIRKITAKSYNDAVEKLIEQYSIQFEDDDNIANFDDFDNFRDYLNSTYNIALSDIEIIDEL